MPCIRTGSAGVPTHSVIQFTAVTSRGYQHSEVCMCMAITVMACSIWTEELRISV